MTTVWLSPSELHQGILVKLIYSSPRSFHQEISHQAIECRRMFDLCPVTTADKGVELDILQRMQQLFAGGKGDHAIISPVYDEGRRLYFTKAIFVSGQGVHSMLARCGEHAGECLLHPRSDARPIAYLGQFVGDEVA